MPVVWYRPIGTVKNEGRLFFSNHVHTYLRSSGAQFKGRHFKTMKVFVVQRCYNNSVFETVLHQAFYPCD